MQGPQGPIGIFMASGRQNKKWMPQKPTNCTVVQVPFGKGLHNYGTSPFFMGKSTISRAIFNSFWYVYQMAPPPYGP